MYVLICMATNVLQRALRLSSCFPFTIHTCMQFIYLIYCRWKGFYMVQGASCLKRVSKLD